MRFVIEILIEKLRGILIFTNNYIEKYWIIEDE